MKPSTVPMAVVALLLALPASTAAANKEHQQLMAEIRMLQEQQMQLQLMWMLPYLVGPAAATLLFAALIGLPLVVGARYAAIVRSRSVGRAGDVAAIPHTGMEPVG